MTRLLLSLAFVLLLAQSADACSVCFGDPESSQGQALNAAVWTLMGTTTCVLGAAAALIGTIAYRTYRAGKEDGEHA